MNDNSDLKARSTSHRHLLETSGELKKALSQWEELCRQAPKVSAEDQMLDEIKGLLSRLKTQLEDFK